MTSLVHCAQCGDVVGVYEPAVLLFSDMSEAHGSLLTFRGPFDSSLRTVLHGHCREAFAARLHGLAGTHGVHSGRLA
jgi:hypothetical protein